MFTSGGVDAIRANGTRARWFYGPMGWAKGRAFDEGTAVGKMAAAVRPSGWWQRWRRRLSAWDGSRMLLLLLLLGCGQGPRRVWAGQTFEYLKREHSLSKPYQGEAPGARWSCRGRASGPELFRSEGAGSGLRGPQETAGGAWEPSRTPDTFGRHRSDGQGSPPPAFPERWKFLVGPGRALRCHQPGAWTKGSSELDGRSASRTKIGE